MSNRAIFVSGTGKTEVFTDDLFNPEDEEQIKKLVGDYNGVCKLEDNYAKRKNKLFDIIRYMNLIAVFGSDAIQNHSTNGYIIFNKFHIYKRKNTWKIYTNGGKNWSTENPYGGHQKVHEYHFNDSLEGIRQIRDHNFRHEMELFRNPPESSCFYCDGVYPKEDTVFVDVWRKGDDYLDLPAMRRVCSGCYVGHERIHYEDFGAYPENFNQIKLWGEKSGRNLYSKDLCPDKEAYLDWVKDKRTGQIEDIKNQIAELQLKKGELLKRNG